MRTDKTIRRSIVRATIWAKKIVVEKEVVVDDRPERCPRCGSSKIWIAVRASNVVFDLKATRRGIKRWAIRYRYNNYRCGACKAQMTPYNGLQVRLNSPGLRRLSADRDAPFARED